MATERPKRGIPEGLWIRCTACNTTVYKKEVEARHHVCPECDHHFTMPARDRIAQLLDEGTFEEWDTDLKPCDPLNFVDRIPYHQRLVEEQKKTGMLDAAVTGKGFIRGRPVVLGITDSPIPEEEPAEVAADAPVETEAEPTTEPPAA